MRLHSQKDTYSGTVRTERLRSETIDRVSENVPFVAPIVPSTAVSNSRIIGEYAAGVDGIVRLGSRDIQPVSVPIAVSSTVQSDSEVNRSSAQITQAMIGHV